MNLTTSIDDAARQWLGRSNAATSGRPAQRGRLWRALATNLAILIIPIAIYYVTVVQRSVAYHHERAFRALAEASAHLDATLDGIQAMFDLVPPPIEDEDLKNAFPNVFKTSDGKASQPQSITEPTRVQAMELIHKLRPFYDYVRSESAPGGAVALSGKKVFDTAHDALRDTYEELEQYAENPVANLNAIRNLACAWLANADESIEAAKCQKGGERPALKGTNRHLAALVRLPDLYELLSKAKQSNKPTCKEECWEKVFSTPFSKGDLERSVAIPGVSIKPITNERPLETEGRNETAPNQSTAPGEQSQTAAQERFDPKFVCRERVDAAHIKLDFRYQSPRLDVFPCHLQKRRIEVKPDSDPGRFHPGELIHYEATIADLFSGAHAPQQFDALILAHQDGRVLASISGNSSALQGLEAGQPPIANPSRFANVRQLLGRARLERFRNDPAAKEPSEAWQQMLLQLEQNQVSGPFEATRITETIGSDSYQVYVAPYRPPLPTYQWCGRPEGIETGDRGQAVGAGAPDSGYGAIGAPHTIAYNGKPRFCEVGSLYLIGLNQGSTLALARASVSPLARWLGTLALVVAVLAWPLVRVLFLETHDALSRIQLRAAVFAAFGLVSVAALAAMSIYGHHALQRWADVGARGYAEHLADWLEGELGALAEDLRTRDEPTKETGSELSFEDVSCERLVKDGFESKRAVMFRSQYGLDSNGKRRADKPRCSNLFEMQRVGLDLSDREYFKHLKSGMGWKLGDDANWQFIVQRIRDRVDGDKLSQVAVTETGQAFRGIMTGEAFFYGLRVPVLPYHFQFAVIDERSGTVVFHSEDRRALIENFFQEIDFRSQLAAAIGVRRGDSFTGRYYGTPHRLFYRPLPNAPWGVITMYPTATISASVLRAGLATLVAIVVTLLLSTALILTVCALTRRRLTFAWPQWRLRNAYPVAAIMLGALLACGVVTSAAGGNSWTPWVALVAAAFTVASGYWFLGAVPFPQSPFRKRVAAVGALLALGIVIATILAAMQFDTWFARLFAIAPALLLGIVSVLAHMRIRQGSVTNANVWRNESPLRLPLWRKGVLGGRLWNALCSVDGPTAYKRWHALCFVLLLAGFGLLPAASFWDATIRAEMVTVLEQGALATIRGYVQRERLIRADLLRFPLRSDLGQDVSGHAHRLARLAGSPGFDVYSCGKEGVALVQDRLTAVGKERSGARPNGPSAGAGTESTISGCNHEQPVPSTEDHGLVARVRRALFGGRGSGSPGNETLEATRRARSQWKFWAADELRFVGQYEAATGRQFSLEFQLPVRLSLLWWSRQRDQDEVVDFGAALVAAVSIALVAIALVLFIARRVLGIGLPWSARLDHVRHEQAAKKAHLSGRVVLLHDPDGVIGERERMPFEPDVATPSFSHDLVDWPQPKEAASCKITRGHWILTRFDIAVLDPDRRPGILLLLERLIHKKGVTFCLTCDVSPQHRILHPGDYPGVDESTVPSSAEACRWIHIFSRLSKRYYIPKEPGDSPECGLGSPMHDFMLRETRLFWPKLLQLRGRLNQALKSGPSGWGKGCETLSERDIEDFILTHADAAFRAAWQSCTRDERLALFQIASGRFPNPLNELVLDHLMRRDLVVLEPAPALKSNAMRRFVLNAEPQWRFDEWSRVAAEGPWQSLRMPLFIVLMLVIAWIAYSAGETFQAMSAVLVGVLGFVGQVLRAVGYVRGSPSAPTG
jgi:hypothetical protein